MYKIRIKNFPLLGSLTFLKIYLKILVIDYEGNVHTLMAVFGYHPNMTVSMAKTIKEERLPLPLNTSILGIVKTLISLQLI